MYVLCTLKKSLPNTSAVQHKEFICTTQFRQIFHFHVTYMLFHYNFYKLSIRFNFVSKKFSITIFSYYN